MDPNLAATIRTKKLGILLKVTRLNAGKSKADTGRVISVSTSTITAFEDGRKSPSLPELERIAHFFGVPLERFWRDNIEAPTLLDQDNKKTETQLQERDKQIGKKIAHGRMNADLSFTEIREKTGITSRRLKRFESGDASVPLPELELLANALTLTIQDFIDPEDQVGEWLLRERNIANFQKIPLDMQNFVTQPVNRPYIELAQRLSALSTEQLRTIAEGLLEITI